MEPGWIMGGVAVAVSLVTLISQAIGLRDKARTTTVDMLSKQVMELRGELSAAQAESASCERDRRKLMEDNERLMRRVLRLDNDK